MTSGVPMHAMTRNVPPHTIRSGPGRPCRAKARVVTVRRFNRRGLPALHTSLTPLAAIREAQPLGRPMQPLTLCAYEVDAEPVFDALDEERCRALGVLDSHLACPAWEAEMLAGSIPASQALAECLIAAGYVGMRVHSFAAGAGADDLNLVMWKWAFERPARVVLVDDEGRLSGDPAH